MSSPFGYLIPDKSFEIGKFKQIITSIFENKKIIDGYYDEEYQWFAAGKNSNYIFTEKNENTNPAFEYVEIHDTINNRIIPDCTSDNYGAKCSNCKNNLDDSLSEALNDLADIESESGAETDMSLLIVKCESCLHKNSLGEIEFDQEVRLANQFVCFVEIDSDFDKETIKDISKKLDCNLTPLYGAL